MKEKAKKRNPDLLPLTMLLLTLLLLLGVTLLRQHGIYKERVSVVLVNGHTEGSDVEVSFLRNPEKQWYESDGVTIGGQYDGKIESLREYTAITDWKMSIKIQGKFWIDSDPWNGIFEINNNILQVTEPRQGEEANAQVYDSDYSVEPMSHRTFGCIMYTSKLFYPESVPLTFEYTPHILVDRIPLVRALQVFLFTFAVSMISVLITIYIRQGEYRTREKKDKEFIEKTLLLFANTIEAKDSYTRGHSLRVAIYSMELAKRMELSEADQEIVYYCAILHDVGKVGIPDSILHKPGKLTDEERSVIQSHTTIGSDIFRGFPYIPDIETIVRHHHERYDGNGYPDQLKGKAIPYLSRIICVADCFDAMTSNRCYRDKINIDKVKKELVDCAGTQFDPEIVPFMLQMIEDGFAPTEEGNV
ncbi:MAG: HD-GYP domain-containing protein [Treponema sp.]|nr:HD-GYP domain-containing protein [Treponema sp.]